MPIHLTCPGCGAKGTLPDAAAGKSAKCPRCQAKLVIPIVEFKPPPTPAPPPPTPVPALPTHFPEDDLEFDPTAPPDTHASRRYNPFDEGPAESEAEKAKEPGKRKYAAEQYNPFAGESGDDAPPVDDPFDYSEQIAPPAAGAFEFGDNDPRRKRR